MPEKKTSRKYWKQMLLGISLIAGAVFYWWSAEYFHETDLLFHLKLYGLPQTLAVIDPPSSTFEVRVRGPRAAIDKVRTSELVYPVNLADAVEGVQSIKIDSERLPLPAEITVLEVSTGDTTFQIEATARKTLPVKLSLTGNPAFGYTVTDRRVHPDQVTIEGPENALAALDAAPTHSIDISGASEPVRRDIALDLPEGTRILGKTRTFSATVRIAEERIEKILDNVAVQGRKCRFEHIIQPETIRLTVNGTVRSLSNPASIEGVSVYLELDRLNPGIYVKPAIIYLPDGIRLVCAEPQVFTVQIVGPASPDHPSGEQ